MNFDLQQDSMCRPSAPQSFTNLTYYNVWGVMYSNNAASGDHAYYLSNEFDRTVPEGGELYITSTGDQITLSVKGMLPKIGDTMPAEFKGDLSMWSSPNGGFSVKTVVSESKFLQLLIISP